MTKTSKNAVPVPHGVHKNYNHSSCNTAPSWSITSSGNEDNVALSPSNNCEESVPLSFQPIPVTINQRVLEPDTIPTNSPVQDTTSHMMSHDSFQQPLENNSSGEVLQLVSLGQLEMETKIIANFSTELFSNLYQQWSNPPEYPPPPPVSPSIPIITPIQESHGKSDAMKLSSSHQADTVWNEEQFVVS